jgi:hypothetical protein
LFFDRSVEGPPLTELFKGHADVEVIHYPEPNRHAHAWRDGVKYFQGKSKWVQFVDIDQVVVPVRSPDLKTMLQDYEQNPALGLNWHSFGGNGLEQEPAGLSTYEAYTKRADGQAPINNHIQSIVQVEHAEVINWSDPHHPPLKYGKCQFNERKEAFRGPFNIPSSQEVGFIAHYYTRSKEYWDKKCAKLRADTGTVGSLPAEYDHHQSYMNVFEDQTVANIWRQIK